MIYIKRVTSADITRQIDLNKDSAYFFGFDNVTNQEFNVIFEDEDTNKQVSGTVKKTGHTTTITGDIYSDVKTRCNLSDIIVFTSTKSKNKFKYFIVNKNSDLYEQFNKSLNLFGSHSSVINETTHLVAVYDKGFDFPCQQVYYGSPGTGKSHKIKEYIEQNNVSKENIFRTTFHPDSDYASFVGCYKPSTEGCFDKCKYRTLQELQAEAYIINRSSGDKVSQIIAFVTKYANDLQYIVLSDPNIISMQNLLNKHLSFANETYLAYVVDYVLKNQESKIVYKFSPQVFTNAYIKAWEDTSKPVYLIIEEINRGNCAQIFGDLFQLLDRDKATGKSEYPIKADKDLVAHIGSVLGENHNGIKNGELCLPPNLIIYATMNTSDQSLFPMDSAFKRRWDWEYVPIDYETGDSATYTITIDNETYKWVEFLKVVNDKIRNLTHSEDKQMGNYFIKKSINQDEFINKVMFYLWDEVCKEEYKTDRNFLRYRENPDAAEIEFSFTDLFGKDKNKISNVLKGFMLKLGVKPDSKESNSQQAEPTSEPISKPLFE